jgi:hypothetical protein
VDPAVDLGFLDLSLSLFFNSFFGEFRSWILLGFASFQKQETGSLSGKDVCLSLLLAGNWWRYAGSLIVQGGFLAAAPGQPGTLALSFLCVSQMFLSL